MFQMGGVGPMMGNQRVLPLPAAKIPIAIDRYQAECRRLFEVLDRRLADHEYLAGDYSIADIAHWAWVRTYRWSGVSIDGLPHLERWKSQLAERPVAPARHRTPAEPADQAGRRREGCREVRRRGGRGAWWRPDGRRD